MEIEPVKYSGLLFLSQIIALPLLVSVCVVGAANVIAQDKPPLGTTYTWEEELLESALYEFSDAAGVAIVFAHRLVDRVRVSGSYKVGDDPKLALDNLLEGTGLLAERIRRGRYVIIAEPISAFLDPTDRSAILGTLRGRVVDATHEFPLWGAHVWLVDLGLGAVAQEDGSFEVHDLPTGEYIVRFSHVGYKPIRTRLSVYPVSPRRPPTIQLQEEIMVSQEAFVLPGTVPDPPPGMTEINAQERDTGSALIGEADLINAATDIPGVSRSGNSDGPLVIRGSSPTDVAYIRDGVPVAYPWHAYGAVSIFQPEAVRRVRLHRGSLPPELGDALAGVMEIETPNGRVEQGSGIASVSNVAARALAEVPLTNRIGLFVAGRRSTYELFNRSDITLRDSALVLDLFNLSEDVVGVTQYFYDTEAKLTWDFLPGQSLVLNGYHGGDHLSSNVAGPLLVEEGMHTNVFSARYSRLGRRAFVSATVYRSMFSHRHDTFAHGGNSETELHRSLNYSDNGVRIDADYFQSVAHQLRGGLWVRLHSLDATLEEHLNETGSREEREEMHSVDATLYVQDAWQPHERVSVLAGVRSGLYADASYVFFEPRLFARWTLIPEQLYVRAGVSRQAQTLRRVRDRLGLRYDATEQHWTLSSDALPPATAWQVAIGSEWAPSVPWAFGLDVYVRMRDHVLEPSDPTAGFGPFHGPGVSQSSLLTFYELSEGRAAGIELGAQFDQGGWLVRAQVALSRTEVHLPEEASWKPSAEDRTYTLGFQVHRQLGNFSASARLSVQSGLPRGLRMLQPSTDPERFDTEITGDLSLSYTFDWYGLQWALRGQAINLPERIETFGTDDVPGISTSLATDVLQRSFRPALSLSAAW